MLENIRKMTFLVNSQVLGELIWSRKNKTLAYFTEHSTLLQVKLKILHNTEVPVITLPLRDDV